MALLTGTKGNTPTILPSSLVLGRSGLPGVVETTISAAATFDKDTATISVINGGASNRNVTAVSGATTPEIAGMVKFFVNSGTSNDLTIRSSAPSPITVLKPKSWCWIAYNGTSWDHGDGIGIADLIATASTWSALQIFGSGITAKAPVILQDSSDATKQASFVMSAISTGTTRSIGIPDVSGTLALTSSNITGTAGGLAAGATFLSTEITGSGSPQNTAHGFGQVPRLVFAIPSDLTGGAFTVVYGAHDSTNAVVTVTSGEKYKVVAFK